jgi:2-methylcitrate dehydratase PrpD
MAAELAREGFTGIPSLFGQAKYAPWMEDLGQHYILVDGAIFKEYACCGWGHTALDATKLLVDQQGLVPGDIEHMRVSGFHELVLLGSRLPTTTEEAQFSTGWPMTMLLLDGEVGPRQLLPERFADPVAIDLLSRNELVESPEYNHLATLANFGDATGGYFCDVEVQLKDGRVLRSGRVVGANKYTQHWTQEQVERKFRWLAAMALPAATVDRLVDTVWAFERIEDVSDWLRIAVPAVRRAS